MNRPNRTCKQLTMETLESRALLAGDVSVSVVRGSLKIEGDVQGNEIAVTDLGGGQFEVAGQNGTTINGQAGPLSFPGVQFGVKISLQDGNDIVSFTGNSMHALAGVTVATGNGQDTVSVDHVFAGYLKIETGAENDAVNVMDVSAFAAIVETGSGDDTVNLGDPSLRPDAKIQAILLKVETGLEDDTVQVRDAILQTFDTEIETGSGNDSVVVQDVQVQGGFKAETGSGTDSVAISDSLFARLGVETGSGDNDQVTLLNTTARSTRLDGGWGIGDSLSIAGSSLGITKKRGFEVIT